MHQETSCLVFVSYISFIFINSVKVRLHGHFKVYLVTLSFLKSRCNFYVAFSRDHNIIKYSFL
jgi:hypothetical protein